MWVRDVVESVVNKPRDFRGGGAERASLIQDESDDQHSAREWGADEMQGREREATAAHERV